LWAGGPANYFKQNAAPLTGVIETSWLPYPFTMNWQLTEPGTYRWERGEPYCMIFPVPAATLENVTPEIRDLSSDPPLHEQCLAWRERRFEHMQEFKPGDPDTLKDAWQRYYFLGRLPTGELVDHHVSKLRLHEPVDRRHSDASKRDDAARKQRDES
jgi:hypothetical protein